MGRSERQGDKGTRGQGDKGTRGQGDKGTRGQGDKGTRGQGDKGEVAPAKNSVRSSIFEECFVVEITVREGANRLEKPLLLQMLRPTRTPEILGDKDWGDIVSLSIAIAIFVRRAIGPRTLFSIALFARSSQTSWICYFYTFFVCFYSTLIKIWVTT